MQTEQEYIFCLRWDLNQSNKTKDGRTNQLCRAASPIKKTCELSHIIQNYENIYGQKVRSV
jgi:hypothetical protein